MRYALACLLALAGLSVPAGAAPGYDCRFETVPAHVEEEQPFTVTVSYNVPAGSAHLHCELKNVQNVVLEGEVAEVRGAGKRQFMLKAPARLGSEQILLALWLGEDWQQALAPIAQTPTIRIVSHADQRRLDAMKEDAAPALERLGYRRSPAGNAAILDDDLPGFDRERPRLLAKALAERGIGVTRLDSATFANPFVVSRQYFDVLILADARIVPAAALDCIQQFAESGGHLVSLGGPAFSDLVWQAGGKWLDQQGILDALAAAPDRHTIFDFAGGAATWARACNDPASPGTLAFEAGPGNPPRCAHLSIANLTGWDTFTSPALESGFPAGQELTCFSARGDDRTPQLSVEWREKDGSRWIAVVPLTPQWRRFALPPAAFHYWHDSASQGRGGPGDRFHPENAERLAFGLAFTHTTSVGGGKHELWLGPVASAPMPTGLAAANTALAAGASLPVLEGISPGYKVYPLTAARRMRTARPALWNPGALPVPASMLAPYARPSGTGFGKNRRWRWVPLLEALNPDGKVAGAPAALVINGQKPYEGGLWLSMPITDPRFFRSPAADRAIADVVARMLDGVFLYEGGSRYFAYTDGEAVDLGAEVANFGKAPADVEVSITLAPAGGKTPVVSKRFRLAVAPGKRETVQTTWSPGRFPSDQYTVRVTLSRAGKVIDALEHPLNVWRPAAKPSFITTRGGNFVLAGKKWYPHGVNYMPSSGIGIEDGPYFEYWLDPQPYDPEIVERDLEDIQAIGFNMVSVFIYYRSLESHNLFDFLVRCRRHGLKVNLSLRPGTPLDFRWDEMRALIERHKLAQNDTLFAYDLAWEPWFGAYDVRKQWDPEWQKWVLAKYGSIEKAEQAWGMPAPRADGRLTSPSDQQVGRQGPWVKLAAAYRRFVDDFLHEKYGEARRLVRSVDPNHLVSFRMSCAGDPTCGQEGFPYDFKGLAGAVDILCPEGYGRIGDWDRVKDGWFTTAYARCVAPNTPVMWAEFGTSIWDTSRMKPGAKALQFEGEFYRDFYEMVLRSGANGTVCWWFPGGFRVGENSDFGILNPDRTWRPVTQVIHEYAPKITGRRPAPKPDVWIPIHRDAHADGIKGIYAQVKDAFWKAIADGKTPGLKWEE